MGDEGPFGGLREDSLVVKSIFLPLINFLKILGFLGFGRAFWKAPTVRLRLDWWEWRLLRGDLWVKTLPYLFCHISLYKSYFDGIVDFYLD